MIFLCDFWIFQKSVKSFIYFKNIAYLFQDFYYSIEKFLFFSTYSKIFIFVLKYFIFQKSSFELCNLIYEATTLAFHGDFIPKSQDDLLLISVLLLEKKGIVLKVETTC